MAEHENLEREVERLASTMTSAEFFGFAEFALRKLACNPEMDIDNRKRLMAARLIAGIRWESAKRHESSLVFALHPGFVWIGNKGFEQPCAHPGHPGIDEAWLILLHRETAGIVLHASTFGSSGNALQGRLRTAARWIEDATGCFDLADHIRAIKVGRDGSITPPSVARKIEFYL